MFNKFKLPGQEQAQKAQEEWDQIGFSSVKGQNDGDIITPVADFLNPDNQVDPDTTTTEYNNQTPSVVNSDVYKELFKQLSEKSGITLKEDEEFDITDSNSLIQLLEDRVISKKAKDLMDEQFKSASPDVKMFLGVKDYFDEDVEALKYVNTISTLESFTDEDMEDTQLQKDVYADYLITVKNHTPEEAQEAIKSAEALSELEEKSAKARKQLISAYTDNLDVIKSKKADKQKAAQKDQEKDIADIIARIDKLDNIKGLPVTDEFKKAVKKNLTTPVGKVNNKTVNDFAFKQNSYKAEMTKAVEVFNTLGLFNFDKDGNWTPDFSKISTIVNKPVKNKLDEMLKEGPRSGTLDVATGGLMDALSKAGYK